MSGKKYSTWRINDDKNIQVGDELILLIKGEADNSRRVEAKEQFGKAKVTKVWKKSFKDFSDKEKQGHEMFESDKEMIKQYQKYYGPSVSKETIVKIIHFKLILENK